jgi:TatA/E family protein of Tat protein translocase
MFGSLGVPELLLIFVVILIVFGPRRIPEIGRTLGKALGEFRKATDDLKNTIEREVRLEELKKIAPPTLESFMTPAEAVSRTEPVTFPELTNPNATPQSDAPPAVAVAASLEEGAPHIAAIPAAPTADATPQMPAGESKSE